MWTLDYVLQLAAIGYTAAYIHTREQGISYNLVTPPSLSDLDTGAWTTNPPFYALLVAAEVLQSEGGASVVDLDINRSKTTNATVAGYAVYDAKRSSVSRLVLFNYANTSSAQFNIPAALVGNATSKTPVVKYLTASAVTEKKNIAWGGETFLNVTDGKSVPVPAGLDWAVPNKNLDCSKGCTIDVPGPSLAVVFFTEVAQTQTSTSASASASPAPTDGRTTNTNSSVALCPLSALRFVVILYIFWSMI
jgi:hypothetical protein